VSVFASERRIRRCPRLAGCESDPITIPNVSDLLTAAAESLNVPEPLVERSAAARATANGTSVDDVLSAWAGGAPAAGAAAAPSPTPEVEAETEPEATNEEQSQEPAETQE